MKLEVLENFVTTGRNTPGRFMLKKPKMSPRLIGNLAPKHFFFKRKTKRQFRSIQKQTLDDQCKFVAHDFKRASLSKRRVM